MERAHLAFRQTTTNPRGHNNVQMALVALSRCKGKKESYDEWSVGAAQRLSTAFAVANNKRKAAATARREERLISKVLLLSLIAISGSFLVWLL